MGTPKPAGRPRIDGLDGLRVRTYGFSEQRYAFGLVLTVREDA